jgi:hypothetical protein
VVWLIAVDDRRRRELRWLGRTLPLNWRDAWQTRVSSRAVAAILLRYTQEYMHGFWLTDARFGIYIGFGFRRSFGSRTTVFWFSFDTVVQLRIRWISIGFGLVRLIAHPRLPPLPLPLL